jgi:hypothetical protein
LSYWRFGIAPLEDFYIFGNPNDRLEVWLGQSGVKMELTREQVTALRDVLTLALDEWDR